MSSMRWPYPRPPVLGRNLPSNYEEGSRVFDERVKATFPVGMREADLVKMLRKQGFSVRAGPFSDGWTSASIRRGVIFVHIWSVRWRATAGQIEDIFGVYAVIAP